MAKPKKQKHTKITSKRLWAFIAGLAVPAFLVLAWHSSYGQEAVSQGQRLLSGAALAQEQSSPSRWPQPYAPAGQAGDAKPRPQAQAKQPQTPQVPTPVQAPVEAPAKRAVQVASLALEEPAPAKATAPAISPEEEFAHMRKLFQAQVQQQIQQRLERYKKQWANSAKLQQVLEERRQRLAKLDQAYQDFVRADIKAQLSQVNLWFDSSQYFVYADRNPVSQVVLVGFYDAQKERIEFLGADLISSGDLEKGGDYYVTPTGVFENLIENFSYRAMGTPNQEGWRGLGAKDSRVWDFGYQKSLKKYKGGNTLSQMRLLMHATDPDKGEQRLGRTDSKGCVRISHSLNRFLDTYAILDQHYEDWAKTKPDSWLLKKDRQPVAYPGKYLVIGDSARLERAASRP